MRLGYACINESLKGKFRTCRIQTFRTEGEEKIKELTLHNFQLTLDIVKWNIEHDIFFYRLSSDLVPFGSHDEMKWEWWEDSDVRMITDEIKGLQEKYNLRLSMHPGQYSVLNSPKEQVVSNCIKDLEYHVKILKLIGGSDMILHTGGEYGNKEEAKKRFIENYNLLSDDIRYYLRLENDDKIYTVRDVFDIHEKCGIPVCFDIHHHMCNSFEGDLKQELTNVWKTWEGIEWIPKVHISTGKTSKTDRSHHDYISEEDFDALIKLIDKQDVDIMFESKKKDLSVLPFIKKRRERVDLL